METQAISHCFLHAYWEEEATVLLLPRTISSAVSSCYSAQSYSEFSWSSQASHNEIHTEAGYAASAYYRNVSIFPRSSSDTYCTEWLKTDCSTQKDEQSWIPWEILNLPPLSTGQPASWRHTLKISLALSSHSIFFLNLLSFLATGYKFSYNLTVQISWPIAKRCPIHTYHLNPTNYDFHFTSINVVVRSLLSGRSITIAVFCMESSHLPTRLDMSSWYECLIAYITTQPKEVWTQALRWLLWTDSVSRSSLRILLISTKEIHNVLFKLRNFRITCLQLFVSLSPSLITRQHSPHKHAIHRI